MTTNERYAYFQWLVNYISVGVNIRDPENYTDVLHLLFSTAFRWSIPMDANRAGDGLELRNLFCSNYGIIFDQSEPCSVLEMMIALANRCEVNIMYDAEYGDRTGDWFWIMMENLGLTELDDQHYDEMLADYIIQRLLDRKYKRNGEGGLFTVNNGEDLRTVEIWYQLGWFLNSIIF